MLKTIIIHLYSTQLNHNLMKLILNLTQFALVIFFSACAIKPMAQSTEQPFLRYERTACSGACPVFNAEFFESGKVTLKVEENFLNGPGTYETTISKPLIADIKEKLKSSGFMNFEDVYQSNMKDLPTTFITYRTEQEEKGIKIYGNAPEVLENIKDELFDTIKQLDWKRSDIPN
jgi:hypothetical protein